MLFYFAAKMGSFVVAYNACFEILFLIDINFIKYN